MEYALGGFKVIGGAFLYGSLLCFATWAHTVQQAMPVGIVATCDQALAFRAMGCRQLQIGATGQMPGQRPGGSGRIHLALSACAHNDPPAEPRGNWWLEHGRWRLGSLFDGLLSV